MSSFNWEYDFDPYFPLHVFNFDVVGNRDKLHWHDYYEIGLCISGSGKFIYTNKEYTVEPGDIFITNNFENHVAITDDDSTCNYIFFIFMPSFIADPYGHKLDLDYLFPFNYNPTEFENKIPACTEIAKKAGEIIKNSLDIYNSSDPYKSIEQDINLRKILLEFSRHFIGQEKELECDSYINVQIQKAIKYMNENSSKNITVAEVAQIIDLSPSYFRNTFKKNTRVSFKEYLTYLRMAHAKKLLLATEETVHDICLDVGYSNISQFYRVFKRYMHLTPTEYRTRYKRMISGRIK